MHVGDRGRRVRADGGAAQTEERARFDGDLLAWADSGNGRFHGQHVEPLVTERDERRQKVEITDLDVVEEDRRLDLRPQQPAAEV